MINEITRAIREGRLWDASRMMLPLHRIANLVRVAIACLVAALIGLIAFAFSHIILLGAIAALLAIMAVTSYFVAFVAIRRLE